MILTCSGPLSLHSKDWMLSENCKAEVCRKLGKLRPHHIRERIIYSKFQQLFICGNSAVYTPSFSSACPLMFSLADFL